MTIISDRQAKELFSETFKYRELIPKLEGYQIKKIISVTGSYLQKEVNAIAEKVNIPIGSYQYPDDVDETKLFEYWADRLNNGYYHKLKLFEAQLLNELNKRNNQVPKDITLEEKFDWIDEANLSALQIAKFIDDQTDGNRQQLIALLDDLNMYAMNRFIDDEYSDRIYEKADHIKKKLSTTDTNSMEQSWDHVLGIVELDKHLNLIRLKHLIEDRLKINTPSYRVKRKEKNIEIQIAKDIASKGSSDYLSETILLFLKAVSKNPDLSADKQRNEAIESTNDQAVKDELAEVPTSTLYTWRKKIS